MIDRKSDVQFWQDAARRKRQSGETACAITFDNMAWLLAHPEGWGAWIKEQEAIAIAQLSPNK